jgi:hypothetical protein
MIGFSVRGIFYYKLYTWQWGYIEAIRFDPKNAGLEILMLSSGVIPVSGTNQNGKLKNQEKMSKTKHWRSITYFNYQTCTIPGRNARAQKIYCVCTFSYILSLDKIIEQFYSFSIPRS